MAGNVDGTDYEDCTGDVDLNVVWSGEDVTESQGDGEGHGYPEPQMSGVVRERVGNRDRER